MNRTNLEAWWNGKPSPMPIGFHGGGMRGFRGGSRGIGGLRGFRSGGYGRHHRFGYVPIPMGGIWPYPYGYLGFTPIWMYYPSVGYHYWTDPRTLQPLEREYQPIDQPYIPID